MPRSAIALISLFLLIYMAPLGVRPLVIPDETRYAEIPREMLATGDWVVPHLDGMRYFEKPALGYWLNALSISLFGENAFAVRLPSAVSAGVSALLLFLLVWRFAGGYWPGMLAASAFLTCAEVFGVGTFNVLDSLLSMLLTSTMVCFFFAHRTEDARKKCMLLGLSGISCGLAFLTKGFLAFVIPVVAVVPFMIWERCWQLFFKMCWLPLVTALLVVLPWSVLIYLREPRFWHYFFWVEHIRRFLSPLGGQHPEPFWYFLPVLAAGALPWSLLFPATALGLNKKHLQEPLLRFAICWFVFPFLFFSASGGKLGTYILPCFPPLVLLVTMGLLNYFATGKNKAFSTGALVSALLAAILAVGLLLSQTTGLTGFRAYGTGETWKWLFAAAGLLSWSLLSAFAGRMPAVRGKLMLFCAAPLLLMFSSHFIIPDQFKERKAPRDFLQSQSPRLTRKTIIVAEPRLVPAACWYYRRNDIFLLEKKGEFAWGLSYSDSEHRLLHVDGLKNLVNNACGNERLALITGSRLYLRYCHLFPRATFAYWHRGLIFVEL